MKIQDESKSTNASKITKDMSFIDVTAHSASEVFNLYRALNYDYPLRCMWGDKLVFLRSLFPIEKPEGFFFVKMNDFQFLENSYQMLVNINLDKCYIVKKRRN